MTRIFCKLGIHSHEYKCQALCKRGCGAERGHLRISLHISTTETRLRSTGQTIQTNRKEWRECDACGWKGEPSVDWSRKDA